MNYRNSVSSAHMPRIAPPWTPEPSFSYINSIWSFNEFIDHKNKEDLYVIPARGLYGPDPRPDPAVGLVAQTIFRFGLGSNETYQVLHKAFRTSWDMHSSYAGHSYKIA